MIRVGVFGATGYAGYELLRWLRRHPEVRVVFTASESSAGASLADVVPGPLDAPLIAPDEAPLADVDLVFLALPHGAAGRWRGAHAPPGCGSSISPPTFA
jgi:N-acetyl-gamma-glutamyl-phosphate reductase